MPHEFRLFWLTALIVALTACGDSSQEQGGAREGSSAEAQTLQRGEVHYLFDQGVVDAERVPWSTDLGPHIDGSFIWMRRPPLQTDDWLPLEGEPEFEQALLKLRAPMEGGPYVHEAAPAIRRNGLEPAAPGQELPEPGQFLLTKRTLIRHKGEAVDDVRITYPGQRSLLMRDFAQLDSGRVVPKLIRMFGGTSRAALAPVPLRYSYQVDLPSGAALEFAAGAMDSVLKPTIEGISLESMSQAGVRFRVQLEEENGEMSILWEHSVLPDEAKRFHPGRVDLAAWAGRTVRLHFEADSAADEVPLAAWAEPVVFGDAKDERPNVLVLLIDTLRADRLGCYGNERGLTPTLDSIADRGVRFADTMSAASWTLPSHASLFTSSYPSQHGIWRDQVLPDSLPTVAEVLHAAGYRTAAFTEGGFMDTAHGFARGHSLHDSKRRDCSVTYARAAEWITARETPYYAFVHTYQVHSPHNPPKEFRQRFVGPYAGELPKVVDTPVYQWGRKEPVPSAEDARYVEELYDAEVAYVDQQIGLFLERLEEAGSLENTLIIVTSDHGEEFFEHGAATHGHSLYQEQLHVPLILHWPGHFEGGRVAEHSVHSIDIAPTIAMATETPAPESFVGSPLSLEPGEVPRPLFTPMKTLIRSKPDRSGEAASSLRMGSLKYISYPTDLRPYDTHPANALFDLANDPGETRNLLDPQSAAEWQRKLDVLYEQYPEVKGSEVAEYDEQIQEELRKLGYTGEED